MVWFAWNVIVSFLFKEEYLKRYTWREYQSSYNGRIRNSTYRKQFISTGESISVNRIFLSTRTTVSNERLENRGIGRRGAIEIPEIPYDFFFGDILTSLFTNYSNTAVNFRWSFYICYGVHKTIYILNN